MARVDKKRGQLNDKGLNWLKFDVKQDYYCNLKTKDVPIWI